LKPGAFQAMGLNWIQLVQPPTFASAAFLAAAVS
jgi:hypothetical protein